MPWRLKLIEMEGMLAIAALNVPLGAVVTLRFYFGYGAWFTDVIWAVSRKLQFAPVAFVWIALVIGMLAWIGCYEEWHKRWLVPQALCIAWLWLWTFIHTAGVVSMVV